MNDANGVAGLADRSTPTAFCCDVLTTVLPSAVTNSLASGDSDVPWPWRLAVGHCSLCPLGNTNATRLPLSTTPWARSPTVTSPTLRTGVLVLGLLHRGYVRRRGSAAS